MCEHTHVLGVGCVRGGGTWAHARATRQHTPQHQTSLGEGGLTHVEQGRRPQKGACPPGTVDAGPSASWPDGAAGPQTRLGWEQGRDLAALRAAEDAGRRRSPWSPQKDARGNWPQPHPRVPRHNSQLPRRRQKQGWEGRRDGSAPWGRAGAGESSGPRAPATPSRGCPRPAPLRQLQEEGCGRPGAAALPTPQLPASATPTRQTRTASPCTTTDGTSHGQEPATRANSFKKGFLEMKLKRAAGRPRAHLPSGGR